MRRSRFRDVPERRPRKVDGVAPPHDLHAEQAVLCACIEDAGAAETAAAALTDDDFFDPYHGKVFAAVKALVAEHKPAEIVSIVAWLKSRDWAPPSDGWPAYVVGFRYVAEGAVLFIDRWCKTVALKARRRRALAACHRFLGEGYFDVGDEQEWLTDVQSTFADYAAPMEQAATRAVSEIIKVAFERIVKGFEDGKRMDGTPTGLDRLDAKTAGLHEGELIIVAARPGMGKTALVMNMAVNVAAPRSEEGRDVLGDGVCVFSLEMPSEQLATRMVCSEAGVDLGRLRTAHVQQDDWRKMTESSKWLATLPIWIDDTSAIGLLDLRAKVRRKQAEYNRPATATQPARRVGLVVVDYLQLMTGDGETREQEISGISRGLKAMAKELKVPVIALSQLNRSTETRSAKDKRPQLSDLRESGAIEQDADTIVFIYRDDYYREDSKLKGIAELIIAKQRSGPTGKVFVRFHAPSTRFSNLEAIDYPQEDE